MYVYNENVNLLDINKAGWGLVTLVGRLPGKSSKEVVRDGERRLLMSHSLLSSCQSSPSPECLVRGYGRNRVLQFSDITFRTSSNPGHNAGPIAGAPPNSSKFTSRPDLRSSHSRRVAHPYIILELWYV
jgi:hypothetical protein